MKKLVIFVLVGLLAFSSCASKEKINDSEIFEEYFEEFDITVFYQDVSKSKTYHLLEALLDHLSENLLPPQPVYSSYMPTLFPTELNNYLRDNKEAAAFFEREDCVYVLISTYLTNLKTENSWDYKNNNSRRKFFFFEMFLSSEMSLSKLNVTEKVQLMVLALESSMVKSPLPFTIMISIMLSNNYPPFIEDVKPILIEATPCCYCLRMNNDIVLPGGSESNHTIATDLITRYAKQFINDNK